MALDIDSVAAELYGLAPGQFTAARDALAADARRSGDRELVAAIKGLKRPTTSAWLSNMLIRRQVKEIDELLALGAAMREAQEQLAGDELRRLSQERRQLVADLSASALGIARDLGQPVSEEAQRELEVSLETALANPVAGDRLRSGCLAAPLRPAGFASLESSEAEAPPVDRPAGAGPSADRAAGARTAEARPAADRAAGTGPAADRAAGAGRTGPSGQRNTRNDSERRRQQRDVAEQVLQQAEAAARTTTSDADEKDRRASEARAEGRRLREAIRQLEAQLAQVQNDEANATKRLRDAEHRYEEAARSAKAADRRVEQARRTLERLRD